MSVKGRVLLATLYLPFPHHFCIETKSEAAGLYLGSVLGDGSSKSYLLTDKVIHIIP